LSRAIAYRLARPDDLLTCTQIWSSGIEDYVRRLNQPWFSGDAEPLRRLLAHFLATDPERFWVATAGNHGPGHGVVGFGSATLRDVTWFLGMLFVLPDFQGRRVGRGLLERVMPPPQEREAVALGTATDSVQPISNALYSQYGMVPRLPVFNFVGRPERPDALPGLPAGVRITETDWTAEATGGSEQTAIAAIDAASLGYAHPQDHAFLQAEGRRRFIARSERGESLGYGYIAPSGRFGPIAAIEPPLLAPITAHLLTAVRPPGAYATWIPGAADELFVMLLRTGFRFESFPTLLLWNRPFADFSRYVPINLALL
jgi:GNAT superfamily N-acetyltransferase